MKYRVDMRRSAQRELKRLPGRTQSQILDRADALADDPRPPGCVKMHGTKHIYRIRCGDYRVIYEIRDEIVLVVVIKIGHRREVYR